MAAGSRQDALIGKKHRRPLDDLIGEKHGQLVVIERATSVRGVAHYRCQCKCGREVVAQGTRIRQKRTTRCVHCARGEGGKARRKAPGEAARNRLVSTYRNTARHKNLAFDLPREIMYHLFAQECFYYGRPPGQTLAARPGHQHGTFTYNGIDRLVNTKGYVLFNVVACCHECNFRKGANDVGPFLSWVARVAEHQKL